MVPILNFGGGGEARFLGSHPKFWGGSSSSVEPGSAASAPCSFPGFHGECRGWYLHPWGCGAGGWDTRGTWDGDMDIPGTQVAPRLVTFWGGTGAEWYHRDHLQFWGDFWGCQPIFWEIFGGPIPNSGEILGVPSQIFWRLFGISRSPISQY